MAKGQEKPMHPDQTRFGKIHAARQANRKVRVIPVPEWDTEDEKCVLYAYPLTVNDVLKLEAAESASISEANVMQVISQCMDENGDKFFSILDKPSLMNEPSDIIGDLLIKLNGQTSSFDQELKKNNR